MVKLNDAKKYYHRYLNQLSSNHSRALESYKKVLMIWKKAYGDDHLSVARCLNNMGVVYQNEKKYSKALECHQKPSISR
jgi:tetratricopeptide (TPR) repeat protein